MDRIEFALLYIEEERYFKTKISREKNYFYCKDDCFKCSAWVDCESVFGGDSAFLSQDEYNTFKEKYPEHLI